MEEESFEISTEKVKNSNEKELQMYKKIVPQKNLNSVKKEPE